MTDLGPTDREGVEALQRFREAISKLQRAEATLRDVMALLDATRAVRWGALSPDEQRQRRLMLQGVHLAWAKIDATWKRILRFSGSLAGAALQEGGQDEGHRSPVEQHGQGDESGRSADEEQLPAPW